MAKIEIKGRITINDNQWYFDCFGMDSTSPRDVQRVIDGLVEGESLRVYISSPGGDVSAGSEIYSMLREASEKHDMQIYITGAACSAASVIAMAGHCIMAPTALMMIHCASTVASGSRSDMQRAVEMLSTADKAVCAAYVAKTGMSEEEVLKIMEHETWFQAQQAKELGLIDEVMFEQPEDGGLQLAAGPLFKPPTEEQLKRARKLAGLQEEGSSNAAVLLQKVQKRLDLMSKPKLNMVP